MGLCFSPPWNGAVGEVERRRKTAVAPLFLISRQPKTKNSTLRKYFAVSDMPINEIYIGNTAQEKYGSELNQIGSSCKP